MPRYLLPKNKSLPQTTPGQWKELSKTEFTTFISEMEVSPDSKINVTSIPSPWARMLLFKEAVKSTNHLMHQEAMSSILDVMEIIFYNQLMNIDIEYKEIKINSDVNNKFLKILYDLSPDELKTDEILKTDDILIIGLLIINKGNDDRFVLAGTSPYTLLFTPLNLKHKNSNGVFPRYFREQPVFLKDRPQDFQKWIKSNFLTKLRNAGNYPDLVNALSAEDGFCAECLQDSLDQNIILVPCSFLQTKPLSDLMEQIKTDKIELYSPYLLKLSKKIDKPPIIIDPSKNLSGTEYYNNYHFLQDFTYDELKKIENKELLPGENVKYPWILPQQDFLQPILIKYKDYLNSDVLILGNCNNSKYALPLTDKFFTYFSYNDVNEMLSIEEISDKTVRVKLRIPIMNGNTIEVYKDYSQNLSNNQENRIINYDDKDIDTPLPYIMIWPPLRPDNWKDKDKDNNKYYAFIYCKRYEDKDGQKEIVSLEFKDQEFNEIKYEKSRKADKIEIFCLDKLPTYIYIVDNINNGKGLIILNHQSLIPIENPINSAKVGIDFGTSHTNIAIALNDSEPEVLKYSSGFIGKNLNYKDFITLVRFSEKEMEREQIPKLMFSYLNQYFLPNSLSETHSKNSIDMPIPSMLLMEANANSYQALLNTSITFSKDDSQLFNFDIDAKPIGKEYVQQTNLKWQPQAINQQSSKEYLRILLLLVEYELIKRGVDLKKVEYHWAFPKSFSETLINDYNTMWNILLKKPKHTDESKAALLYFDYKGKLSRNNPYITIVIDTGGGSSDISIWQNGKVHLLYSSLWAGKNLIGFEKDKIIYSSIYDAIAGLQGNSIENFRNISSFYDRLNYTFYALSEDTLCELVRSDSFYKARFLIIYFYSALFYEIGIQCKAISMDNITKISIVLAGNGSRFAYWSSGQVDNIDEQEQEIYKKIIKEAIPFDIEVEFFNSSSQDKKREVALGLCKGNDNLRKQTAEKEHVIAEKVKLNEMSDLSQKSIAEFNDLIQENGHLINLDKENSEIVKFHNIFFNVLGRSDLYRDRLKNESSLSDLDKVKDVLIGDWSDFVGKLRGVIEDNINNYGSICSSVFTLGMQVTINKLHCYLSGNH